MYANFSEPALKVMAGASAESRQFNHFYIGVEHILLGLLMEGRGLPVALLRAAGVDPAGIQEAALAALKVGAGMAGTQGRAPEIDRYTRDLTREAAAGQLSPVVGRDAELLRLAQIL